MRIDSQIKIVNNSPTMVLKEGIIANNDILNFEEFKQFMFPRINENLLNSFYARLNQIEGSIKKEKYKEAYQRWENLEKAILFNKDYAVSLLFIGNIDSPEGEYTFQYASKEYDVLSDRGKLTRIKQLSEQLFKQSIEEQLSFHLNEFLNDVEFTNTRYKFIKQVFSLDDSEMKSRAANARWHTKNWTYKNILYGDNPMWRGNVADAFVNHLAHLHVQTFASQIDNDEKNIFATSVFKEEKDNIWKLLYDSKNNTPWFTGGDIVFKYQGQIYNIQLKTGIANQKRRNRIGGRLAVKDLLNLITLLKNEIKQQNINNLIQILYDELKTSGYVELSNQAAYKFADQLVDGLTK